MYIESSLVGSRGLVSLKWVRVVLLMHTSYLMSVSVCLAQVSLSSFCASNIVSSASQVPSLFESISSLYEMMESRCNAFTRLTRLQGKLELMVSQVRIF